MDIDKEIDEMAEKMAKSVKTEKETLVDLVRELGAEGIKKAMPTLSQTQQTLLKAVIAEELQKSMKLDDKIIAAPKIEAKIGDTKLQEDRADDNADEKIAQAAESSINHQGGEKQDGWQGQVIKALTEAQKTQLISKMMDRTLDDELVIQKCSSVGISEEFIIKSIDELSKGRGPDLQPRKRHGRGMGDMGANRGIHSATDEKGVSVQGMKQRDANEEKDPKAKADLIESAKNRHQETLSDLKNMPKLPLAKAEEITKDEAKDKIMSMEEKEHGTKDPKKLVEAEKKENEVKKSFSWEDPSKLLKACTGGRNHHFSVNDFYDEALAKSKVAPTEETLAKSEKESINDILAKGMDCSPLDVQNKKRMEDEKKKVNGKMQKSFADVDMAQALGLSEEECKKILGDV